MRWKLRPRALAVVMAGALALSACGSGDSGDNQGNTLRFGISGEVPVLKAGQEQGNLGITAKSLIHRGLVSYDADGQVVPALAESFEQTSPTEYRFVLTEGLTFHDGTEITLDSVKNTWNYFAEPENGSAQAETYAGIESVEAVEGGEFVVTLAKANSTFLQTLADVSTPILPDVSLDSDAESIVGAGPFAFTNKQAGVGMSLERFDGYVRADDVALDGIELVYYADGASRVNALQGGDVDLIDYVPWENFDQLEQAGFTVDGKPGPGLDVQFNVEKEPLNDPLVREAIAYALDRDKVVENVFSGYAKPVYGQIVEPGGEFDRPEITDMYEYDPDRARELLAEAGHEDGFDISLLGTSQYAFVQDTAISVQQDLEAVGITTELELPDWPTMMDNMLTGNYDLGIGTISSSITDPSYLLRYVDPPAYVHPWGYENAELSALLKEGRAADTEEERIGKYEDAFALLREDTPYAVLMQREQAYGFSENVKGFSTLPGLIVFSSGLSIANVSLQ